MLNTMASVVAIAALVSVLWFCAGLFTRAFTPGSGLIGGWSPGRVQGLELLGASGQNGGQPLHHHLPESVFAMFQLAFAIITCAW